MARDAATYHLTAGRHQSTVGELAELASAFFGRPAPRLINPAVYRGALHPLLLRAARDERQRRALRRSEIFFPYFAVQTCFDERRARVALRAAGVSTTPLRTYFDRLVEFALAAGWGRRELPRAAATAVTTPPPVQTALVPLARTRLVLAE